MCEQIEPGIGARANRAGHRGASESSRASRRERIEPDIGARAIEPGIEARANRGGRRERERIEANVWLGSGTGEDGCSCWRQSLSVRGGQAVAHAGFDFAHAPHYPQRGGSDRSVQDGSILSQKQNAQR